MGGEGRGEQGWDWKGRKEKGGDSMRREGREGEQRELKTRSKAVPNS